MLRTKAIAIGMMVAVAAFILIAAGCTTSNPISPVETGNDPALTPGEEAILSGDQIDSGLLDEDIMTGQAFNKIRPEYIVYPEDGPTLLDFGERLNDFEVFD